MAESLKGAGFCSGVEFEVTGDAAVMGYCHCNDCAEWAGAPVTAFGLWPIDGVRVVKGADAVGAYNKTENATRKFCTTCGGHVMTEYPGYGLIEVYPNTVPGLVHEPTLHVHYQSKTVAMRDGLPKFKDLPAEFGGSGDLLAE